MFTSALFQIQVASTPSLSPSSTSSQTTHSTTSVPVPTVTLEPVPPRITSQITAASIACRNTCLLEGMLPRQAQPAYRICRLHFCSHTHKSMYMHLAVEECGGWKCHLTAGMHRLFVMCMSVYVGERVDIGSGFRLQCAL